MIEAHIADGDFVVIQKKEHARDGQIVAVRDDDGDATLKRFFKEKNRVRLEPANKAMKPIAAEMLKGMPRSARAMIPPTAANGTLKKISVASRALPNIR